MEVKSLEVKSYHVEFISYGSLKSFFLELVMIDKEQKLYQLIPVKEYYKEFNALDFAHICCELFGCSDLDIHSLCFSFLYHDGKTISHTITRTDENNVESYFEQILLITQVFLTNTNNDSRTD